MKTDFCLECGSQYTGGEFIELLKSYNVEISMDGIGRYKDNIFVERTWRTLKYEWIFLRDYRSEEELRKLHKIRYFSDKMSGQRA